MIQFNLWKKKWNGLRWARYSLKSSETHPDFRLSWRDAIPSDSLPFPQFKWEFSYLLKKGTLARTYAAQAEETLETLFLWFLLTPKQTIFTLYKRELCTTKLFSFKKEAVYKKICPSLFFFGLLKSHVFNQFPTWCVITSWLMSFLPFSSCS